MKTFLNFRFASKLTPVLPVVITTLCFLLSGPSLKAQDCSTYYPIKEGVRLEYKLYGKKDKLEGTQWQEFTNVTAIAGGVEATVQMGFVNAKGKEEFTSSYAMSCSDNMVRIDFESMLSSAMILQQEQMEAEITGTDIELPNNLEVGMELPDADVKMKLSMGAMNMNMEVNTTDRKVEAKESITTEAGTFECYVISSNTQSKMMMADKTFPSKLWLAEGVGVVKTESYNQSGKLISRMELSGISR